jgi:U6 snRNA-associated Sm-like protein LSm1
VTVGKICYYADVPLGLYLVRGDSMVLLGEVEEEDDDGNLQNVSLEELEQLQNKKNEETTATTGEDGPVDQERLIWDFDTDLVV